mmetsp:Transcript_19858/g.24234  ORF Transcript_19858/g.24234 Transcript_19858/m.24234 type:complete len:258 (-) Transcript_19858:2756-3529(-)
MFIYLFIKYVSLFQTAKEFRFLDEKTVCYFEYAGSGAETAAHIMQNGRCTFMFVALEGMPKIMRFYGKGRIVLKSDIFTMEGELKSHGEVETLCKAFDLVNSKDERLRGMRSIIILDVERVADSCGYSIPKFEYVKDRNTLKEYIDNCQSMDDYICEKNSFSIDGLKGIGQVLRGSTPTKRIPEKGYYFAEYEKKDCKSKGAKQSNSTLIRYKYIAQKLLVQLQIAYASGLNGRIRDLVFFLTGVLFIKSIKRIINF